MLYNVGRGGDSAELGISLGEEGARGRGLGREAVIVLLRWAWNNRPLRLVYLHALEWNQRAIRAFRAAGFDETARVIRDGQVFVRMEVRREWWLLWEMEGRFTSEDDRGSQAPPAPAPEEPCPPFFPPFSPAGTSLCTGLIWTEVAECRHSL